jgi:hypothetical protein
VLFGFPYRGEGRRFPTSSLGPVPAVAFSHEFRGILCAILCVDSESPAQRIVIRSGDFSEITVFARGVEDSMPLHAHEADPDNSDPHHLRFPSVFLRFSSAPSFPWNPQKPLFLFVFVRILVRFQIMVQMPFLWKTISA